MHGRQLTLCSKSSFSLLFGFNYSSLPSTTFESMESGDEKKSCHEYMRGKCMKCHIYDLQIVDLIGKRPSKLSTQLTEAVAKQKP